MFNILEKFERRIEIMHEITMEILMLATISANVMAHEISDDLIRFPVITKKNPMY